MPGYISEVRYSGGISTDFIEVVVPRGTDTSLYSVAIYDGHGVLRTTLSLGTLDATLANSDGYVIGSGDTGFIDIKHDFAIALVDDTGTVVQFLGLEDQVTASSGPADGQTSNGLNDIANNGQSVETKDGGATYSSQATPNPGTIPCYAPGIRIDTPDGPRAVETLRPGDLVSTLDHGPQELLWTSRREQPLDGTARDARPVMIRANALGPGRPVSDLIVSPQHRIFVGGHGQLQAMFPSESLVPAKSLTDLPGVRPMMGRQNITWIHFALGGHQVVFANGCLSESLLLGPMVVNGLTGFQRQSLYHMFGTRDDGPLNGPPVRPCLNPSQAKRHLGLEKRARCVAV